jgi:uncharacterized RDD family membrane protein YckC
MNEKENFFEEYDGAILFHRWIGTMLDTLVLGTVGFILILVGNDSLKYVWMIIWIIVASCYYIILEGFWGMTVGKLAVKIRVVNKRGKPPGVFKAAIRTIFRVIEVNPLLFGGLPAGVVVFATKNRRRLGDLVAGTYVFYKKDLSSLDTSFFTSHPAISLEDILKDQEE